MADDDVLTAGEDTAGESGGDHADSAPEELRATSFGAFWFVTGIANLLASLGAGLLWDREGSAAIFITSAGVAAMALAMLSLLPPERRRPGR